jgi:DNA-binding NarL/FixJ family response regulator
MGRLKYDAAVAVSRARPRVVIVDDHPAYRQGLAMLLGKSGIDVVAEAASGLAGIRAVEETAPDVVIMDLNMPGLSGVEATRRLSERIPASRVLVLSVSAESDDVLAAILAGASGYVLKAGPVEEVIAGVEAVAAGESLISPHIAAMLLQRVREREQLPSDLPRVPVTKQELEVLELVAEGKVNAEIGEALLIGPSGVRNHISSVLGKLHVWH